MARSKLLHASSNLLWKKADPSMTNHQINLNPLQSLNLLWERPPRQRPTTRSMEQTYICLYSLYTRVTCTRMHVNRRVRAYKHSFASLHTGTDAERDTCAGAQDTRLSWPKGKKWWAQEEYLVRIRCAHRHMRIAAVWVEFERRVVALDRQDVVSVARMLNPLFERLPPKSRQVESIQNDSCHIESSGCIEDVRQHHQAQ